MTHDTPPKRIWTFDRYVNGILMAEGVEIEKAETFEQAAKAAVRLASSGPKGEAPVLVLRDTSEAEAMVAAALRDLAQRVALQMEVLSAIHQSWPLRTAGKVDAILALIPVPASAALDKLIAEAEARGLEKAAEICEGIRTGIANGPMPEGARFDYEQAIRAAKGAQP